MPSTRPLPLNLFTHLRRDGIHSSYSQPRLVRTGRGISSYEFLSDIERGHVDVRLETMGGSAVPLGFMAVEDLCSWITDKAAPSLKAARITDIAWWQETAGLQHQWILLRFEHMDAIGDLHVHYLRLERAGMMAWNRRAIDKAKISEDAEVSNSGFVEENLLFCALCRKRDTEILPAGIGDLAIPAFQDFLDQKWRGPPATLADLARYLKVIVSLEPNYTLWMSNCFWFSRLIIHVIGLRHYSFPLIATQINPLRFSVPTPYSEEYLTWSNPGPSERPHPNSRRVPDREQASLAEEHRQRHDPSSIGVLFRFLHYEERQNGILMFRRIVWICFSLPSLGIAALVVYKLTRRHMDSQEGSSGMLKAVDLLTIVASVGTFIGLPVLAACMFLFLPIARVLVALLTRWLIRTPTARLVEFIERTSDRPDSARGEFLPAKIPFFPAIHIWRGSFRRYLARINTGRRKLPAPWEQEAQIYLPARQDYNAALQQMHGEPSPEGVPPRKRTALEWLSTSTVFIYFLLGIWIEELKVVMQIQDIPWTNRADWEEPPESPATPDDELGAASHWPSQASYSILPPGSMTIEELCRWIANSADPSFRAAHITDVAWWEKKRRRKHQWILLRLEHTAPSGDICVSYLRLQPAGWHVPGFRRAIDQATIFDCLDVSNPRFLYRNELLVALCQTPDCEILPPEMNMAAMGAFRSFLDHKWRGPPATLGHLTQYLQAIGAMELDGSLWTRNHFFSRIIIHMIGLRHYSFPFIVFPNDPLTLDFVGPYRIGGKNHPLANVVKFRAEAELWEAHDPSSIGLLFRLLHYEEWQNASVMLLPLFYAHYALILAAGVMMGIGSFTVLMYFILAFQNPGLAASLFRLYIVSLALGAIAVPALVPPLIKRCIAFVAKRRIRVSTARLVSDLERIYESTTESARGDLIPPEIPYTRVKGKRKKTFYRVDPAIPPVLPTPWPFDSQIYGPARQEYDAALCTLRSQEPRLILQKALLSLLSQQKSRKTKSRLSAAVLAAENELKKPVPGDDSEESAPTLASTGVPLGSELLLWSYCWNDNSCFIDAPLEALFRAFVFLDKDARAELMQVVREESPESGLRSIIEHFWLRLGCIGGMHGDHPPELSNSEASLMDTLLAGQECVKSFLASGGKWESAIYNPGMASISSVWLKKMVEIDTTTHVQVYFSVAHTTTRVCPAQHTTTQTHPLLSSDDFVFCLDFITAQAYANQESGLLSLQDCLLHTIPRIRNANHNGNGPAYRTLHDAEKSPCSCEGCTESAVVDSVTTSWPLILRIQPLWNSAHYPEYAHLPQMACPLSLSLGPEVEYALVALVDFLSGERSGPTAAVGHYVAKTRVGDSTYFYDDMENGGRLRKLGPLPLLTDDDPETKYVFYTRTSKANRTTRSVAEIAADLAKAPVQLKPATVLYDDWDPELDPPAVVGGGRQL
ncbi:hypothetical protein GGX14DRAFT_572180 [Mycena pura]|uniref:Uncharacterized protein n=1 Tax=Mycena pura TaxID=153505 RepID=A0AAD6V1N5_9AGAR|nr:hypothetical protein GGX14DRAFT_572180 [Mycena pura]